MNTKLINYLEKIELFLKNYLEKTNMNTYILGLSGGVDSSLTAALAKSAVGKDRLLTVMMPIESDPSDLDDALKVAKALDLNYVIIDGTETFLTLKKEFENSGIVLDKSSLSNLKVRIRMSILYAYAQKNKGLVLGTDNKDERYVGYFTKYGDGAADVFAICQLIKSEVVEAAKYKGVPTELAERTPSAGLFQGQTDETEMGVTYKDLDAYLLGEKIDPKIIDRIEYLHRISEHKRNPIPEPEKYIR